MSNDSIAQVFKIYAKDADSQHKIWQHIGQLALTEKEPGSLAVRVTPDRDNPVPMQMLADVFPLAATYGSSTYPGLKSTVENYVKNAAATAAKKSGGPSGFTGAAKAGP